MQDRPITPEEGLTRMAKILALDAPLTDEVCQFLMQARGEIVGMFTEQVAAFSRAATGFDGLGKSERADHPAVAEVFNALSEMGRVMREALMEGVVKLSARMAEVVTAVAEAEPLDREWTPEEIEQAKADWEAKVIEWKANGEITNWPLGPLADSIVGLKHTGRYITDELRKAMSQKSEPKSDEGEA